MGGDVVGLVAFDLVLRMVGVGAVCVALVVKIRGVDLYDTACHKACFRVPSNVVAYIESLFRHNTILSRFAVQHGIADDLRGRCERMLFYACCAHNVQHADAFCL